MAEKVVVDEKLAEVSHSINNESKDFKDKKKKEFAWDDVTKEVGFFSSKQHFCVMNINMYVYKSLRSWFICVLTKYLCY